MPGVGWARLSKPRGPDPFWEILPMILKKTPKLNYGYFGFHEKQYNRSNSGRFWWLCDEKVTEFFPEITHKSRDLIFTVHSSPATNRVKIERTKAGSLILNEETGERNFLVDGVIVRFAEKASIVLNSLLKKRSAVYVECTYAE